MGKVCPPMSKRCRRRPCPNWFSFIFQPKRLDICDSTKNLARKNLRENKKNIVFLSLNEILNKAKCIIILQKKLHEPHSMQDKIHFFPRSKFKDLSYIKLK